MANGNEQLAISNQQVCIMTNIQIQLSWDDPATGERREPRLSVPIAFGREFARMPVEIRGQPVARMLLNSNEVSRYHTLIDWEQNREFMKHDNGIEILQFCI